MKWIQSLQNTAEAIHRDQKQSRTLRYAVLFILFLIYQYIAISRGGLL